jgi:protocatechuate 3,4-dioxygenase beta subunit
VTIHLNRREALAGAGTVSLAALIAACGDEGDTGDQGNTATSSDAAFDDGASCTLTPEQTEGPFYFDADAVRSDVREDREGVKLRLALRVRSAGDCEPIRDAVVEIWHCDAAGSYSAGDERYLRGAQVTSADGTVDFTTIYPGWYTGRTIHIHAKVHVDSSTVLTTQLYFDDDITAAVYKREPYASRQGRDMNNDSDGIFDERTLLSLSEDGDGYLGVMTFDVESA